MGKIQLLLAAVLFAAIFATNLLLDDTMMTPTEMPANGILEINVVPSTHSVTVNGNPVDLRGYNIGGYNFFRLRDLAYALIGMQAQFYVDWWNYTILPHLNINALNIHGHDYFALREVGNYLGLDIDWCGYTATILIDTNEPVIDDVTRIAVEHFLSPFTSLFSFSQSKDSDALVRMPVFGTLIDPDDNVIIEAPFISSDSIAWSFHLIDLSGDSTPDVLMSWLSLAQTGPPSSVVYLFQNGSVYPIPQCGVFSPWSFYRDNQNRLLTLSVSNEFFHAENGLFHFDIHSGQFYPVCVPTDDSLLSWKEFYESAAFWANPTIKGTDITLTRVRPMIALQNEITANILERLETQ